MAVDNFENYQENNIFNLEEYTGELSSLKDDVINKSKESKEYDKYPYINEQDYKKYFAPETYNFKQFGIGACRFVASIYGITQMENYKNLVKNSVKKDERGDFIVKIPLSTERNNIGTWHKIDISVYQNQRIINGDNPQILQNNEKDTDSGSGIVALAMAIGEEIVGATHFDIHRLESGNAIAIFLDGKAIKDVSLEKEVDNKDIKIDELKEILKQNNTIVIARVKSNNDGFFETAGNGEKSNHEITILKIIKDNDGEYIQYYDPNFLELKKMSIDDFLKKCFGYEIFCKTNEKHPYDIPTREKSYQNEENENSAGMVVENTKKPNETLRNLRGDFITYQENGTTIVESRGKRAEITKKREKRKVIKYHSFDIVAMDSEGNIIPRPSTYRYIYFANSDFYLDIDISKLLDKHKGEKNEQYKEHLYLPKIANFMNRMIYNYIDTESRNKENPLPFSITKWGDLVFDDDPYHVNLDEIENSERRNIESERRERIKEKEKPWNHKLVCLRHRSELGIHDEWTKQVIANTLNEMVMEKRDR